MPDSTASSAVLESAQYDFSHSLLELCNGAPVVCLARRSLSSL
jgi:hypothetical protein